MLQSPEMSKQRKWVCEVLCSKWTFVLWHVYLQVEYSLVFLIEVSGNVLTNIVNMIELQSSQLMTNILKQLSKRVFVKVPSIQAKFAETWKLLQGSDLTQKLTVIEESHLE